MNTVRQYIGARYVIKVYENSLDPSSAEWQSGVTYEPLTMVTYLNSSYLSKKDVPGSVGNPADNPSYWILTGAYNGQIASLQNQIDDINNNTIPGITSDISTLQDDVSLLQADETVIIGDSYATVFSGHRDKTWAQYLRDYLGADNVTIKAQNAYGFCTGDTAANWALHPEASALIETNNFMALLLSAYNDISDPTKVKNIIVCGGGNDGPYIVDYIYAAMDHFGSRAKELFPNAKVYVGYIFNNVNIDQSDVKSTMRKSLQAYSRCQEYDMLYLSGVENLLHDYALIDTADVDGARGTHPNNDGCMALYRGILNAFINGYAEIYRIHTMVDLTDLNTLFTEESVNNFAYQTQKNDMVIMRTNSHTFTLSTATNIASAFKIGEIEKRYLIGNYDTSVGVEAPVRYKDSNNDTFIGIAYIYVNRYSQLMIVPRIAWSNVTEITLLNTIFNFDTFTA